jgi:hypothetical protein
MINNENGLSLLSLNPGMHPFYRDLYVDCMVSILIISPILIYLNFIRNPTSYDITYTGVKDYGTTYEQLTCHAFSQIVYGFYPQFNMLYTMVINRYILDSIKKNNIQAHKFMNTDYVHWAVKYTVCTGIESPAPNVSSTATGVTRPVSVSGTNPTLYTKIPSDNSTTILNIPGIQ